jgi:hypothetical protein
MTVTARKNRGELRNWAVPKTAATARAASRNAEKPASATLTRARAGRPVHSKRSPATSRSQASRRALALILFPTAFPLASSDRPSCRIADQCGTGRYRTDDRHQSAKTDKFLRSPAIQDARGEAIPGGHLTQSRGRSRISQRDPSAWPAAELGAKRLRRQQPALVMSPVPGTSRRTTDQCIRAGSGHRLRNRR